MAGVPRRPTREVSCAYPYLVAALLGATTALPLPAQRDSVRRDSTRGAADASRASTRDLPLEPTRTVSLDTDEGSWISLDVSPDGRTIVFDLLGDLYTLPIGGAAPARPATDTAGRGAANVAGRAAPAANPGGYQPQETRVEIHARRDTPRGTVVLRGAHIITMRGAEVIERGDVVVRDNRIVAVGPSGSVTVPAGAREFDASGKTVVPGFVDTHAHLRVQQGVHLQPWAYLANLAYGVTTTRDPQTGTTDVLTYEDAVMAGTAIGPRIDHTGPGLFGTGYLPAAGEDIEDLEHARRIMRRYSRYYDTKTLKMYMSGNRQQRQWIIQAAREQQIMPTTEGALDVRYDPTMVMDGYSGLEHAIPTFPVYRDVVALMAESGIAYTPTLIVAYNGPWGENYFFETENVYGDPKLRRFTPYEVLAPVARRRVRGSFGGGNAGGWFLKEEYSFEAQARVAPPVQPVSPTRRAPAPPGPARRPRPCPARRGGAPGRRGRRRRTRGGSPRRGAARG